MAFYVVEVDNDGFKVYDSAGNAIDPAKDASVTALGTILTAIKDTDGIKKIVDALPAGTNTIGKVDQGTAGATAWKTDGSGVTQPISASSLPLPAGAATETTLALIKSTDGIKKIVDPLPAGTNTLGKVDQGAAGASAWLVVGSGGGGSTQVEGRAADGATPVGNPVLVGGQDGTNVQSLLTDTLGRLVMAPQGASTIYRGFSDGKVVLHPPETALAPVRFTTYTEQTSNAQRSITSSNVADAAAGTGARTVKITYYSVSGGAITGPFYETVTLDGTSYVDTVSTTIAFIEKLEVLTVGSGLTNAGTLTLKANTAGGGATIVTIGIGDGQTFLGLHYVASGRTMKLTSVAAGIKGVDAAGFMVRTKDPSSANAFEMQTSDLIRIGANQSTVPRAYGTPIEIAGPARVQLYVLPDSTSSRTYYASMDYFEE